MGLENIKQIAVLGAGNMGAQIAQIASQIGGYQVMMMDVNEELVATGLKRQRDGLQRFFVDKGKMTADDMQAIVGRIKGTTSIPEAVSEADFVIEAVFDNMELKRNIFKQLDEAAPPEAIMVTNTSYLSVTEIASTTRRPEKVGGMHFFNPVAVMKLVEVVRAALTSEETSNTVYELAKKLGKDPVFCRDVYGFLANRAALGTDEAVELLWSHVATPEDIDKAIRLGYNRPMGPLELGDLTGTWNIQVFGEEDRVRELGESKGRVHPMVRMMVRAGYTGGPGKKGIYDFWRDVLSKW
ncbi:3-hydroxyacyl-CoA dehydrogenase family protein [Chloroflexota bacterium]